jgi:hypothetical protein
MDKFVPCNVVGGEGGHAKDDYNNLLLEQQAGDKTKVEAIASLEARKGKDSPCLSPRKGSLEDWSTCTASKDGRVPSAGASESA